MEVKRKQIGVLAAALLVGVGFAYFILGRTVEEPGTLVEEFEGAVDTMKVHEDWTPPEIEEEIAPADSVLPDSLD